MPLSDGVVRLFPMPLLKIRRQSLRHNSYLNLFSHQKKLRITIEAFICLFPSILLQAFHTRMPIQCCENVMQYTYDQNVQNVIFMQRCSCCSLAANLPLTNSYVIIRFFFFFHHSYIGLKKKQKSINIISCKVVHNLCGQTTLKI